MQDAILSSLKIAGILTIAIAAPNLVQLLKRQLTNRSIQGASERLAQKGFIAWQHIDGKRFMQLTAKGEAYINARTMSIAKPKHWDGKWRIVIFDIAEPRRRHRTQLRRTLIALGFKRLQDSVWVFPYDCEELITLLKTEYGLGKEVLYIIADSIERDWEIIDHFKLRD